MDFEFNKCLRNGIRANLVQFERNNILPAGDLKQAAVGIMLVAEEKTNQAAFVLTRRTKTLRRHSGQYALPGGRLDDDEDVQTAVLREIAEEIGVRLEGDAVLGWLDDFVTRSGFCITPVVVWAGIDYEMEPDPNEVEAVFKIPLWDLNRPEIPHLQTVDDSVHPVLSAPFKTLGRHVYAPTAAILYQFKEVGLHGRTTRVAHFEQPRFAWE
ncbi:MAG: CoA pyrophosphatase [Arenicellales bacterium]|nr:CoA pyrophosphatase [Arenicellales bacterium]